MKLANKLENLKLKNKIILFMSILIIIALVNFLFYNFRILTLSKEERTYEINYTFNGDILHLENQNKYVKYLNIEYQSDTRFDISMDKPIDACYPFLHNCGIPLNQKIDSMNLNLNENVEILSIKADNSFSFNWETFVFWSIGIGILFVMIFFKSFWLKKIHFLSLLLCLSIGSILLVCSHNMTSTTLDDDSHFKNINALTIQNEAETILENYQIWFYNVNTQQEKQELKEYLNKVAKENITLENPKINLFHYSTINYFPMALIYKFANTIGFSFTVSFFLGRLVNLLIYSVVVMIAVKKMPHHKLLTMLIALLPQSLFLASNYNYDPTVTAFSLLSFSAFAYEYYHKEKKINWKNVCIFIIAGLYAIFPKMVYAPLLFLMLLLPNEKFKNKRQCCLFKTGLTLIVLLCLSSFILPTAVNPEVEGDSRGGATSVAGQMEYIIQKPLKFVKMFTKEGIFQMGERLFGPTTFGLYSYYGDLTLNTIYYLLLFTLLFAFVSEKNKIQLKMNARIFIFGIIFIIMCFIYLSMYLAFTPVGANAINGVQARYFIPLLLPLFYCLSIKNLKYSGNEEIRVLSCTSIVFAINLLFIYIHIVSYYCL